MNSIGLVFFVLIGPLYQAADADKPVSYEGFRVYEVIADEENISQLRGSRHGVSVLSEKHVSHEKRPFTIRSYLVPSHCEESFCKALDEVDAIYNVTVSNIGKLIEEEKIGIASRRSSQGGFHSKIYHSYEEIMEYLIHIGRIKNPVNDENLAVVEDIGNTYEGRDVFGVRISSEHKRNKPIIFFEAGIHAREWTAPAAALYMLRQLVENYTHNAHVLNDIDFYVIPLANPDGYEYSRLKDRLWRKTRSLHVRGHYGVDPNRNFDFHWGETGSSSDPSSDIYKGPFPFSEPEARNIRDVGMKYKDRLVAYVSIHAYGPYILYPWGYSRNIEAPDTPLLREIASRASEAMKKFGGSNYVFGTSSAVLYESAGGSDDYFKGVLGVPLSYTVELSSRKARSFIVPPQNVYGIVAEAYEGFKVVAQCAVDEKLKARIRENRHVF